MTKFSVGDIVVFNQAPMWLLHDLPREDQERILKQVGKKAVIEKIEPIGYYWLGFELNQINGKFKATIEHWFCVTEESLILINDKRNKSEA